MRVSGFVAMLVGLMLFFGAISRIGKVSEAPMLSAPQRRKPQRRLEEERQRIVALYGLRPTASTHASEEPKSRETPAAVAVPQPQPRSLPTPEPRPAETPRPFQPPVRQPEKKHYIVRPGDTLWGIARREYGDGNLLYILENANPGLDANSLRPGQSLVIPQLAPTLTLGQGSMDP